MKISKMATDARVMFIADGLKLFKQAPLLGRGGGTWAAMYAGVQRKYYGTINPHCDPFTILLEAGLIGLGLYAVFIFTMVISLFNKKRGDGASKTLIIATLAVVMHSFVEGLTMMPFFYFVIFSFLGAVSATALPLITSKMNGKIIGFLSVGGLISVLLVCGSFALAELEYSVATKIITDSGYVKAEKNLSRVLVFNYWHSQARLERAY
ncbi:MAG: O-antigen ligase family protein, partial [bacterium]|nr:O-antigen ligase family protein [bacterium]